MSQEWLHSKILTHRMKETLPGNQEIYGPTVPIGDSSSNKSYGKPEDGNKKILLEF